MRGEIARERPQRRFRLGALGAYSGGDEAEEEQRHAHPAAVHQGVEVVEGP
jgi:hypothetical protein